METVASVQQWVNVFDRKLLFLFFFNFHLIVAFTNPTAARFNDAPNERAHIYVTKREENNICTRNENFRAVPPVAVI